jgi:hypothetical protein
VLPLWGKALLKLKSSPRNLAFGAFFRISLTIFFEISLEEKASTDLGLKTAAIVWLVLSLDKVSP